MQHNIVQLEFIHIPSLPENSKELTEMLADVFSGSLQRMKDEGSGLTTTNGARMSLRFYDQGNAITSALRRLEEIGAHRLIFLTPQTKPIRDAFEKKCISELLRALREDCLVAVENADHSFREALPEERHDIQERIKRYEGGFDGYIFAPNNLLADKNELVGTLR